MDQYVLRIEIAYLFHWGFRCILLSMCHWCVWIVQMQGRRTRNRQCLAICSWPSFSLCLHLLDMLVSLEWCHSFVHISAKWLQGNCGGSARERSWSECCYWGNCWWMKSPELQKCISGYWNWNAECGNGMVNNRIHQSNFQRHGANEVPFCEFCTSMQGIECVQLCM